MKSSVQASEALSTRFFQLLDEYAAFVTDAGSRVRRSPREVGQKLFQALTDQAKTILLDRLQSEIEIFENMRKEGKSVSDSSQHFWRFLVKCKLTPCSDLFSKISSTDIIQVYGLDQTVLFVNINFFEHVSFTLEQVFCMAWHEATKRDLATEQRLHQALVPIFSGEVKHTIDPQNPWHLVKEVGSELLLEFQLRIKAISPLFAYADLMGMVAIVECKPN